MTAVALTAVALTAAQRRLWALAQLRPGDPFFTIPFVISIDGPLDHPALERALTEVVGRHAALRARIHETDGGLVQTTEPAQPVVLPIDDIADVADFTAFARDFASAPCTVDGGELFRVRLVRLAGKAHRLLVNVHHIVFDGVSLQVFVTELVALYGAHAVRRPAPLAEPPPGYAEFIRILVGCDEQALPESLDYWTRRLAGASEPLELPTIGPRPVPSSYQGARRSRLLPQRLLDPLRRLASSRRATMYMVLKAAWDVLLHRYGNDDVRVGIALSGRDSTRSAGIVGYLSRPIVLRSTFGADETFTELLARVRVDVLDAHDHPDLPIESVLGALGAARDPSYDPLFQVMFSYQPADPVRYVGDVAFTVTELPLTSLKAELSIGLIEGPDGLLAEIDYRVECFNAADVDRMLTRLETLLERIGADPGVAISALCSPTEAELRELARWSRGDGVPTALTRVDQLIQRQAARIPDAVAVEMGERRWSYRELDTAANRWARRLSELKVGPECRVGICLQASAALPAVLLGVLKTGGVCVPLDPERSAYQLRTIIEDTEPRPILADAASAALLDHTRSRVVELDPAELYGGEDLPGAALRPEPAIRLDGAACVLYTSGYSGEPKAVVIEHANLAHTVAVTAHALPANWSATVALVGPPTSIAALTSLFAAFAHGGTVTVPASRGRADAAWPLSAPGDTEHVRYGTVETAGVVVAGARRAGEPTTIGRPLGAARAYVLDAQLRPVPSGALGELYLGGTPVTRGYLDAPGETARRYLPDPFSEHPGQRMHATGDLVRHGPDGSLRFVARAGHRSRARGCAIVPGGLEAAALPGGERRRSSEMERIVAGTWTTVLGRDVGPDENFFDVGGNSLLLVRLRDQLSTIVDREVDVVELFRHSTVRAMAGFLAGNANAVGTAGAVGSQRGRTRQELLRALRRTDR